jgi:hypothetical protein
MLARALIRVCVYGLTFTSAFAQSTTRISVDSAGVQANGPSSYPAISGQGNLVAFVSSATNLVPADTNGFDDVFARILSTNTLVRISVDTNEQQANGLSEAPAVSSSGRLVAFASTASMSISIQGACSIGSVRSYQG